MDSHATSIDEVDRRLPAGRTALLGFQHVLVMYSACIVVPLILGAALGLAREQLVLIINADLFAAGIASLVQSLGFFGFGMRMPVMMGVTFTAVTPMIAIGTTPSLGLPGVYGAIIASGIFGILAAPLMGRFLRFFPAVVTGSVLLVIGISLMKVGIEWSAGGHPTLPDGSPNPRYGSPLYLGISLGVMALILLISRYGKGFFANVAVLLGVTAGFGAAWLCGEVDLGGLGAASWVAAIRPFAFGWPVFDPLAIASMCLVMVVTLVESTGMFLALGQIVERPTTPRRLVRGLRADGLGAVVGGVFNAFPYTSFSQNIGLVTLTGVKSRYVCAAAGVILILLGLFPKMAYIVAAMPPFVLGAAALVMFGMVAIMGVRILATVDFERGRGNALVAAVSIGVGMIPLLSHTFFGQLPPWTRVVTDSGIILTTVTAIALNLLFNGVRSSDEANADAARHAALADA
ncbi:MULTISPECIES: nucleobase:cation symporter-2 family protein [unclassified Caballeronia]|uniref:nucleobase:cation symporter-2 family protein n=1 Tax=unclassified Caballeronia TaxID=2646786 RepID=UPI001F276802|nr:MULTISPECIES: nucleobase:cation symporter-2 family protein [unclassified Caballeronia]MCE4546020.1 purine permease [Caballeronia sp. PC1]MCE4573507.1 purine permease [Caballeronia sp. CLC5]